MHHFQTTVAQRNQQQTARSNLHMIDLSKLLRLNTYPVRTAQVIEVNPPFRREHSGSLRRRSIDAIATYTPKNQNLIDFFHIAV